LLRAFFLLALLTLPSSAFCIIFADSLVDLLLGDKWHSAVVPFAILSGALYFRLAWRGCGAVFQALGRPHVITAVQALRAAALILGVWYAQPYGLEAICGVVVLVMAVVFAIMLVMVIRAIDLSFWGIVWVHLRPAAIGVIIVGIGMSLKIGLIDVPASVQFISTLAVLTISVLLTIRSTYSPLAHPRRAFSATQPRSIVQSATLRVAVRRKEGV
jgi:PST family polysaccharide transporter